MFSLGIRRDCCWSALARPGYGDCWGLKVPVGDVILGWKVEVPVGDVVLDWKVEVPVGDVIGESVHNCIPKIISIISTHSGFICGKE